MARKADTRSMGRQTTTKTTTGESPYKLIFGQESILPIEFKHATWIAVSWDDNMSTTDLLKARMRQMEAKEELVTIAADKVKKSRERNKIYFEKKHKIRHNPLEEGYMVLLYDSTIGKSRERKLDNRWNGPYIVTKSLGNGSYYLRELDGTRKRGSVAGNRLKRFYRSVDPRSQELIMQGEDVAVETDDEAEGS
ncbi:hypothetical protein AYI69_g3938 [Smittium culicis]|uniref:Uncharacterized protein n=1 Tax=Smittium culicis TaxID=133412 RepID=A0A1R1YIN7_9FUNG|nr:hypothetical protein AYI69_g3938 [Smittium culicis]